MPDKPIQDWTFAEIKEYCSKNDCQNCVFYEFDRHALADCSLQNHAPESWKVPKRYSKEAAEAVKHIMAMLPCKSEYRICVRNICAPVEIVNNYENTGFYIFPTSTAYGVLKDLDGVKLKDIINEGDQSDD